MSSCMDCGQDSFLGSTQTAVGECAVNNKSCEDALRLCSVSFRCARRAPFPRPYHNQRVGCLMLCRQRANRLEQHFLVTDHRSRGYRVTTCRLWLTFVSGLDHYNVLITQCDHNKHQACSSRTPLRDIDLQWCLVEDIACLHSSSYLPSMSSSCLADQRFSQPHHCFPQWLASVFLTSSLYPATDREQQNVGSRLGQPQSCSALFPEGSRRIDRARCKQPCLVIVTVVYMQERHRLIASISTFCNFRFLRRLLSRSSSTAVFTG